MANTSVAAVNTLSKEATLILFSRFPAPSAGLDDSLIPLQLPGHHAGNVARGCGLRATRPALSHSCNCIFVGNKLLMRWALNECAVHEVRGGALRLNADSSH
jgi:hypothetical protein